MIKFRRKDNHFFNSVIPLWVIARIRIVCVKDLDTDICQKKILKVIRMLMENSPQDDAAPKGLLTKLN